MANELAIIVFLSLVLVLSLFQSMEIAEMRGKFTATGVVSTQSQQAGSSEYEQMMDEMHPGWRQAQSPQQSPATSMVGGC